MREFCENHGILKIKSGNMVNVKLFKPVNKQKEFSGILENYSENEIILKIENEIIKLDKVNVAMVKTVAEEF